MVISNKNTSLKHQEKGKVILNTVYCYPIEIINPGFKKGREKGKKREKETQVLDNRASRDEGQQVLLFDFLTDIFLKKFCFIEEQLIHNVVLISAVHQ